MKRDSRAIRAAYDFVDATKPCPNCRAAPGVWCSVDGRTRWIPCVARLQPPLDAEVDPYADAEVDPYQAQLPRGNARPLYEQIHHYDEDD